MNLGCRGGGSQISRMNSDRRDRKRPCGRQRSRGKVGNRYQVAAWAVVVVVIVVVVPAFVRTSFT